MSDGGGPGAAVGEVLNRLFERFAGDRGILLTHPQR